MKLVGRIQKAAATKASEIEEIGLTSDALARAGLVQRGCVFVPRGQAEFGETESIGREDEAV